VEGMSVEHDRMTLEGRDALLSSGAPRTMGSDVVA
jgi:hypothetical protein